MKHDQDRVDKQCRHQSLNYADHSGRFSRLLQMCQTELVADIKGNKSKGDITEGTYSLKVLHRIEPYSVNAKSSQYKGTYKNAGDQKRRYIRKVQFHILENTGHHQPGKQRKCSFQ